MAEGSEDPGVGFDRAEEDRRKLRELEEKGQAAQSDLDKLLSAVQGLQQIAPSPIRMFYELRENDRTIRVETSQPDTFSGLRALADREFNKETEDSRLKVVKNLIDRLATAKANGALAAPVEMAAIAVADAFGYRGNL